MRKDLPVARKNGQVYAELLCDFMFKRLFGSEENKVSQDRLISLGKAFARALRKYVSL